MSLEISYEEIIKPENLYLSKSKLLNDNTMHYCPGCSHGVITKLVAQIIEEMGIQEKTVGIAPVGCGTFIYNYVDIDWVQASHGRAPSVATGVKRLNPEKFVFTYQGDGDLAAIGTAETIHTCNRGENITIIFINNAIYGMTGGQMAPTTLHGQKTATTPFGRDEKYQGYPLKMSEIVALLPGTSYVTKQSVDTAAAIRKCKKAMRKAFEYNEKKMGTTFVEILSTCNSNWKLSPVKANKWMQDNMVPFYGLGDVKDIGK